MVDIILFAVIAGIIGAVIHYICKAKKSGAKCIGCPDAKNCSGSCHGCSGCNSEK